MAIFRTVVLAAAAAGFVAGLMLTAIQHFATLPLILRAETYEHAASAAHTHAAGTPEHHHDADEGWQPSPGFERFAYTALANVVGGIGFALLLVAAGEMAGGIAGWHQGMFWGLGGFVAVTLAPSLGLPPELPGMPAADLIARQIWWVLTAVCTASGLALVVFRRSLPAALASLALIVAPHVIGAPQPTSGEALVPHQLAHNFAVGVLMSSMVFWVLLGGFAGFLRARLKTSWPWPPRPCD